MHYYNFNVKICCGTGECSDRENSVWLTRGVSGGEVTYSSFCTIGFIELLVWQKGDSGN